MILRRLFLLFAASALLPGCASPLTYRVRQVVSPDVLLVEMPHGLEEVGARYAYTGRFEIAGDLRAEALAFVQEWVADGVRLYPEHFAPLSCDRQGRLRMQVERPGDRESLSEALLKRGYAFYKGPNVGDYRAYNPYENGMTDRCYQAAHHAQKAKLGYHAVLALQPQPVAPVMAERELGRAHAALERTLGFEPPPREIQIVDRQGMSAAHSRFHGQPVEASEETFGFAPPGPTVYVRDLMVGVVPKRMAEGIRVVLIHELMHAIQADVLGAPFGPHSDPDRPRSGTSDVFKTPLAVVEGFAEYWTGRVTTAEGLSEAHLATAAPKPRYTDGFTFWRTIYERLEAAGETIALKPGSSEVVDRVHALLMSPERTVLRDREVLLEPQAWLEEQVPGWPKAAFALNRVDAPGPGLRFELRSEVPLVGYRTDVDVEVQVPAEGGGWERSVDWYFRTRGGEGTWILHPSQALTVRVTPREALPPGARVRVHVKGLLVAKGPAATLRYGSATSEWVTPAGD